MFEQTLQTFLLAVPGVDSVYWDAPPDGHDYKGKVTLILQKIGGRSQWYMDRNSMPSHKHARVQVMVWGSSRATVAPVSRAVEDALALSDFVVEAYGAATDNYEPVLKLAGSQQHFGIWYPDP